MARAVADRGAAMRRVWTLGGGLTSVLSLAVAVLAFRPAPTTASLLSPVASAIAPAGVGTLNEAARFTPLGAGSCAAGACHGGSTPLPPDVSSILRNEHTTWITRDPHADAYSVLSNERSQRIARNLAETNKDPIPATQDARCLACHATPTAAQAGPDLAQTIARDGVSCESCHGDSSAWIGEHTRFDWAGRDPLTKSQSFNFTNLRDLPTRAQTCTGCHVGAPADPSRGLPLRDVNHDLIAAGHPRLNWEFSAYTANYPKHWIQKGKTPDWDARLWKVGQIATMKAASDLLAARATDAAAGRAPWPELSEYSCFSCHFSLQEQPFRGRSGSPLGVPQWASWNLAVLPTLAKLDSGQEAASADAKIEALRGSMSRLMADPRSVAENAHALSLDLDRWLSVQNNVPLPPAELTDWVSTLNPRDEKGKLKLGKSWDSAAQVYLALAAAHASLGAQGQSVGPLGAELERLAKELGFCKGYDSPMGFGQPVNDKAK